MAIVNWFTNVKRSFEDQKHIFDGVQIKFVCCVYVIEKLLTMLVVLTRLGSRLLVVCRTRFVGQQVCERLLPFGTLAMCKVTIEHFYPKCFGVDDPDGFDQSLTC